MAPKVKPDDLVEALSDTKVLGALADILSPLIEAAVSTAIEKRLAIAVEAIIDSKMGDLLSSVREMKSKTDKIEQQNITLREQLTVQTRRIDEMEALSRYENLVLRGIPEQSYAERGSVSHSTTDGITTASYQAVENTVIAFCKDSLHIEITPHDISFAHRIKTGPKDAIRPVLVRFTSRRVRDQIYRSKKLLKGSSTNNVYISEHLSRANAELFFEARKLLRLKKLHSAWTQMGLVHVKFTTDPGERPTTVKCLANLSPRRN